MTTTNAMRLLMKANIPFDTSEYTVDESDLSGVHAAHELGIDPDVIATEGAVSYEVAAEMAENIRQILAADIGIGVTGLAGPDGDGVHEVGTVFVSLATENETFVKELHLGAFRTRSFIRRMAGNHIYDMVRRYLTGLNVI